MKIHTILSLMLFFTILGSIPLEAQEKVKEEKVKEEKDYKNTVRLNLTNPLLFGERSLVLGYERTMGLHQSFSVNAGLAQLPTFNLVNVSDDSSFQIDKTSKDKGYTITGDYRFYLASENKYNAPRGLYIGPYLTHVFMGRENIWTLHTETFDGDIKTDFKFNMTSIGAQLGYQFILWKRVALDFVLIGPSIAKYNIEAKLDTSLNPDDESALYEKINELLTERFPGYSFAVDDVEFKKTGTTNTTSLGYRYVIHMGFRF